MHGRLRCLRFFKSENFIIFFQLLGIVFRLDKNDVIVIRRISLRNRILVAGFIPLLFFFLILHQTIIFLIHALETFIMGLLYLLYVFELRIGQELTKVWLSLG